MLKIVDLLINSIMKKICISLFFISVCIRDNLKWYALSDKIWCIGVDSATWYPLFKFNCIKKPIRFLQLLIKY